MQIPYEIMKWCAAIISILITAGATFCLLIVILSFLSGLINPPEE